MSKEENENFILDLKVYKIPSNLQTYGHIENQNDIEDLSQRDTLQKFVTTKGFQDIQSQEHAGELFQVMTRNLIFHLPPFLNPQIWKFYRMNHNRIYQIFQVFPPLPLWCLCLLFQLNVSTFALKPSYANSIGLIRDSKAPAKKTLHDFLSDPKISQIILKQASFQEGMYTNDKHKPPLPVYITDYKTLNLVLEALPSESIFDSIPLRHPIPYSKCFLIRGKKYIPYLFHKEEEKKYILLVRVVSAYTYFVTYDVPSCISFDPIYILLKDELNTDQLFCSVDDAIYITDVPLSNVLPARIASGAKKRKHKGTKKPQKKLKK